MSSMSNGEYSWSKFNGTYLLNDRVQKELFFSTGKDTLSYDDVSYDLNFIPNVYLYKDFSIGNNIFGEIRVKEPVFLMYQTAAYVHFLLDSVAVYYSIKDFVPGLKPYFINPHNYINNSINFEKEWMYIDGLRDIDSRIINLKQYRYIFEQVYDFDLSGRKKTVSTMYGFPFHSIRKNLLPTIKENDNSPKKIYVSRIDSNNRSIKDIAKFEMFLADKGFSLIKLSGMKMEAQLELFFNATDVISFSGSGLTNTVFCKPGTNVLELNRSPDTYTYNTWAKNCKTIGINYTGFSFLGDENNAFSYIEQINNQLNYIGDIFS